MAENIAGLLCYAGGWITGVIFLLIDDRPFVRFHAAQSILVFVPLNIIYFIVAELSSGGVILDALSLIMAVIWIVLMVKAYQDQRFAVPLAAEIAGALPAPLENYFAELAGKSSAGPSIAPAVEPFDAKKGSLTSQIVSQIGRWSEDDAEKVLGAPANKQALPPSANGDLRHSNSYGFSDPAGKIHQFGLTFRGSTNLLDMVMVIPQGLTYAEMKVSLGDAVADPSAGAGMRAYGYGPLHMNLMTDDSDNVLCLLFNSPAAVSALRPLSGNWVAHLP